MNQFGGQSLASKPDFETASGASINITDTRVSDPQEI